MLGHWNEFAKCAGFAILLCLACSAGTLLLHYLSKPGTAKNFALFWKTRLALQIISAAWLVAQWLRLEAPWCFLTQDLPIMHHQKILLCRWHFTVSLGVLEPLCMFTAILLCRGILSKTGPVEKWINWRILTTAALLTAPESILQASLAKPTFPTEGFNSQGTSMTNRWFSATYAEGTVNSCGFPGGCLLCASPLAASLASLYTALTALVLLWGGLFGRLSGRIDKRKSTRLIPWQLVINGGLVLFYTARFLTAIRVDPFTWVFQVTSAISTLLVPLSVFLTSQFLRATPIWDRLSTASKGTGKWA